VVFASLDHRLLAEIPPGSPDWRAFLPDDPKPDLPRHVRNFAAAGDPFSLAILEGREIP